MGRFNPLQDLVNNLANGGGSAVSRNTVGNQSRGVDRYAGQPMLASLQLDNDQVNTGSEQPSPGAPSQSAHRLCLHVSA